MNDAQNDDSVKEVKKCKYSGYLAQVDVVHVTLIRGLLDIYTCLSKTQHGVSKVNQLPWHYTHRIENLQENLHKISVNQFEEGNLKKSIPKLQQALFHDDTPICNEKTRPLWQAVNNDNVVCIKQGLILLSDFAISLENYIKSRISISKFCELTEKGFHKLDKAAME